MLFIKGGSMVAQYRKRARPKIPWHCESGPKLTKLFDGLLLGGGSLTAGAGNSSASFRTMVSLEKKPYLEWVKAQLRAVGMTQIKIIPFGCQNNPQSRLLYTGDYYELFPIYWRWYGKGKKDIPGEFELTSNIALCLFLRAGNLEITDGKKRKAIRIWIDRYSPRARKHLISEFHKIGIHPALYEMKKGTMLRIASAESPLFLKFIGECPEYPKSLKDAFGYKWDVIRG